MTAVNFRSKLFSLLAKELENFIPQFKPYTLDYQVVVYASKDLETWLRVKMDVDDNRVIYKRLEELSRSNPRELKVSVSFWANAWLKKWRERVRVLSKGFEMPRNRIERVREARRILQKMEFKDELRNIVVKKLIDQGEICMTEFIADNLIVEEVAKRIQRANKGSIIILDPISIYNAVSVKVMRLSRERGPLIYLNIKPNIFQQY